MNKNAKPMNCEEFAALGFDFGRGAGEATAAEREAAEEHLRGCSACAAQKGSWTDLQGLLKGLGRETREEQAPARVETELRRKVMRLGYAHRREQWKRASLVAGLAAAAVVVAAVAVRQFPRSNGTGPGTPAETPKVIAAGNGTQSGGAPVDGTSARVPAGLPEGIGNEELAAQEPGSSLEGEFTRLPGSLPEAVDDAAIVHVRMQRGTLGSLGLTVNEERAGEWILVDLLVSTDGQPQAIRLSR